MFFPCHYFLIKYLVTYPYLLCILFIPVLIRGSLLNFSNPRAIWQNATDILLFVEKVYNKEIGRDVGLGSRKLFKIAIAYSRVLEFLKSNGWEFQGKNAEMEMDSFKNKKTGKKVFAEDISEDFPVTFLMASLACRSSESLPVN